MILEWIKTKPQKVEVDVQIPASVYENINLKQYTVKPFVLQEPEIVPVKEASETPVAVKKPMFKPKMKL